MKYIFGYGSLVDHNDLKKFLGIKILPKGTHYTYLNGFERSWDVAMDNSKNVSNYKFYVNKVTDIREEIFISFLNIRLNKKSKIKGILLPIEDSQIKIFDSRERNYSRINISEYFDHLPQDSIVYTYIGLEEAKKRYLKGRINNNVYVSSSYYERINETFKSMGDFDHQQYLNSWSEIPPLKDLTQRKTI